MSTKKNTTIIAFCDAAGIIGFGSKCPPHALGFASGPEDQLRSVVEAKAKRRPETGVLCIPEIKSASDPVAVLSKFGAETRAALEIAIKAN